MDFNSSKDDDDWETRVSSDLSRVCRLCLRSTGDSLLPIFGYALAQRIMACAKVKVFEGDGLPTHVCLSCCSQVDRCYQFKLLCERSDRTLRGNLQNGSSDGGHADDGDSGRQSPSNEGETQEEDECWDMSKFTPEVIIDEVEDQPRPPPPALLPQMLSSNGLEDGMLAAAVRGELGGDARAAIALALGARSGPLVSVAPPQQPKSRRCRGGEKAFKCRLCNKSYSFSSALSRHKAVHNTALRPHVCTICKKGFTQLEKLLRHQRTHTMVSVMACDTCSTVFKSFSLYHKHKMSGCPGLGGQTQPASGEAPLSLVIKKEEDSSPTPQDSPQDIEGDAAVETDESRAQGTGKGRPEFTCNVCHKCFASRSSLEVHSTIHTGVRPFVCSICHQAFRHKVNLMEHFQRKHSQVRPYQCDVCAARFVTKQELVRHYRKHIGD